MRACVARFSRSGPVPKVEASAPAIFDDGAWPPRFLELKPELNGVVVRCVTTRLVSFAGLALLSWFVGGFGARGKEG